MSNWQDRIIGFNRIPASDFLANPQNPRRHPGRQRDALRGSLDTLGWVAPVLVNKRTGFMLDGHARIEEALSKDENALIPVIEVDLEEHEEKLFLASFDYITYMAEYDRDSLDSLLQDVQTDDARLQAMLSELAADNDFETVEDMESGENNYVPDTIFPSDNDLGIPMLDIQKQAKFLDLPFSRWGKTSRKTVMNGTYHFYTDDYKFTALWEYPDELLISQCVSVVEPNFSTNPQMPRMVVLWGIYCKRWLSRYWQSYGVNIIVDLNVEIEFEKDILLGVPHGWGSYAVRARADDERFLDRMYQIASERAGGNPSLFVVYAGGNSAKTWAAAHDAIWIMEDAKKQELNHG